MTRRLLLPALATAALVGGGCASEDQPEPAPPRERPATPAPAPEENRAADPAPSPATPSRTPPAAPAATANTIRLGGATPAADAAAVARAMFPGTSAATRPGAVALVDSRDWRAGIAAAALAGPPVGAPLLLSQGERLPRPTLDALEALRPTGAEAARGVRVIRVGEDRPSPPGLRTGTIDGRDPYELAAAVDSFVSSARGESSRSVVIASGEMPPFAMPAAAWAARTGDPVLFVRRDSIPSATATALRRHGRPDIYLLGPEEAISPVVEARLGQFGRVRRIAGDTPAESSVAFARYRRGRFGWGITAPGYNFAVANASRPLDAAAAAALGTNGVFAPLLVTEDAERLPRALESYLLDLQPGYEDDPRQGVYNRAWLLGGGTALSPELQGRLDEVAELVPVAVGRREEDGQDAP